MIVAFGPRWTSELPRDVVWGSTPVGQRCVHCNGVIREGDLGLYVADPDEPPPTLFAVPIHLECFQQSAAMGGTQ